MDNGLHVSSVGNSSGEHQCDDSVVTREASVSVLDLASAGSDQGNCLILLMNAQEKGPFCGLKRAFSVGKMAFLRRIWGSSGGKDERL